MSWPENSLTAFRESANLPIEMVECDVHLSRDGEPVVIHDAALDRTTEGCGPVSALDLSDLKRLRLRGGGGETIPALMDLASLLGPTDLRLQVEIKADASGRPPPELLEATVRVLDAAGLRSRCGILAFDALTAAAARSLGGLHHVAWLVEPSLLRSIGVTGVIAVARAHRIGMIETHAKIITAATLRDMRAGGLQVGVWGTDDHQTIRRMLDLAPDVIATDDPALAAKLRREDVIPT